MVARALERSGSVPLWQQLQRELIQRLNAGEFTERFPGEFELTEQYGVSRHTVRQALGQLKAEGVVVAERGRPPRVASPPEIRQPMGALYSLFASVEAAGLAQRSVVRTLGIRADGVVADRLGLDGAAPLVYLERIRLAGDEPLALDRVWLPADLARPLLEADFAHTGLYKELADLAGVRLDQGREEVQAIIPSPAERVLLQCPHDTAAFSINRLSRWRGRPVEWRQSVVRGDRFALIAEFAAKTGYRLIQPEGTTSPHSGAPS